MRKMRKYLLIIAAITSLLFAVTACNADDNIPTLSEYLNGDAPVVSFWVDELKPDEQPIAIDVFEHGTITHASIIGSGLTLSDFSEMTDEEIIELARDRADLKNVPYFLTMAVRPDGLVHTESIWSYLFDGQLDRITLWRTIRNLIDEREINGAYYYKNNNFAIRCEHGTVPFKFDPADTPDIYSEIIHNDELLAFMQAKMDAVYKRSNSTNQTN